MTQDRIPGLISRLHEILDNTESTNTDLQAKVLEVEEQLQSDLDQVEKTQLIDQLNLLETEFANKHPLAEATIREIIGILGRMGI